MGEEVWGEASVTYPDWKGTAQLDERKTGPWEGLAQRVELDNVGWQVVGFSISGGESGFNLMVYAAPRDVWENLEAGAPVQVTEFKVHDVEPLAILQEMTHTFQMNMRRRGLEGREVQVMAKSDLPLELFVDETFGRQDE
ncbi:hypothetical protein [Nocardia sp. NPDC058480]|uniref:hypothetical protein n=1 Tax=unclassified Nocardia TaxID=2637762 RepID=UPI00365922D7